ncbi:MAG: aminoacetone oxidase family FAD-binding enzyme [Oscillospiraceae bacterium]|nr:aminoacetone oxidase family FAD-binding enzyme [Oscillospiraceae bacterium]
MRRRVIVIGGGASGLSAAIAAAEQGASVTVLERQPRVGRKILLTGNGRCNLGNENLAMLHFHGTNPYASAIMQQFDTKKFFRGMGLYTRTDAEGRMYPASGTAASVLDALRFRAEQLGAEMLCDRQVTGLKQTGKKWQIICGDTQFMADAAIVAAGGSAAPACGTDGNMFPILKRLGLTVIPPRPALCPVPTDAAIVKPLKGIRVRAEASAYAGGKCVRRERGEVQFTDRALSGICIFNLSRIAAMHGTKAEIGLDLLPDYSGAECAEMLQELVKQRGEYPAAELLSGLLPKRVGEVWVKAAFGTANAAAAELLHSEAAQRHLLEVLRGRRFPVTGTASFAQAQVTAGGIAGQSLTKTLAAKGLPGLYICGEAVDTDGDCGGYNLTWCWASGVYVGKFAANQNNM